MELIEKMPPHSILSSQASIAGLALTPDEREQMTRFLRHLVQTPSPFGEEEVIARLIQEHLSEIGLADVTTTDRVGNVVVRLGTGDGPTLLYDVHMDTVLPTDPDWPCDPYGAVVQDGVLYGVGACDAKSSLAAMVYAARRLQAANVPLNGTLILAFVVQRERCEGAALQGLIEEEGIRPDWVLLGEPSNLHIMRGHRGRVLFRVTAHGRSSHASRPTLGENAIAAAARLVFGVDLLATDLPTDPILGSGTMAVTHIESQAPSLNAIPDTCTLFVDRRLTLGETVARAHAQLESVIEREGIRADIEVNEYATDTYTGYRFHVREAFDAWALEENHPLVQTLSAVVHAVRGQSPILGHWPFSTDGVYSMGTLGIPTAGFGPGNPDHAHTTQEQVRLDDVAVAAQVYALFAATLLGEG